MSNMDFLLNKTNFVVENTTRDEEKVTIKGLYYGSEDLSYEEYMYTFDLQGNFINCIYLRGYQ